MIDRLYKILTSLRKIGNKEKIVNTASDHQEDKQVYDESNVTRLLTKCGLLETDNSIEGSKPSEHSNTTRTRHD